MSQAKTAIEAIAIGRARIEEARDAEWAGNDERIHVSDLTDCERRFALRSLGVARSDAMPLGRKLVYDVGRAYHKVLQTHLGAAGVLIRGDEDGNRFEVGNRDLVCHPDALAIISGRATVIDFKSVSEFRFAKLSHPFPDDVAQLNGYLGLLGLQVGLLVYVNKSNGDLKEFGVLYDATAWRASLSVGVPRLKAVLAAAKATGDLPAIPADYRKDKWPCMTCPYQSHCWGNPSARIQPLPPPNPPAIDNKPMAMAVKAMKRREEPEWNLGEGSYAL